MTALALSMRLPALTPVAQSIQSLFAAGEQGYWLDPSDFNATWRRNLFTETEFRNGLTDAAVRGGLLTATTMTGYAGALAFGHDGATATYAYKSVPISVGAACTISVIVEMTDGLPPAFGSASPTSSMNDFVLVGSAVASSPLTYVVESLGGSTYRVRTSVTSTGSPNWGITKYAGNSSRTFKVTGYQVEQGSTASTYQRITDGVQDYFTYGAALPVMYQDPAGTMPVTALEQTVGLILDKSKGLVLGPELFSDASASMVGEASRISEGVYRIYASGGTLSGVTQTSALTVGKTYIVEFTIDSIATVGAGLSIDNNGVSMATFTTTGRKKAVITATVGTILIKRQAGATDIQISGVTYREIPGNHFIQTTSTARPKLTARVNLLLSTEALATQSVTTTATSFRLRFEGTGSVTLSGTATGSYSAGTHAITCTAGTLTLTVSGSVIRADLRHASHSTSLPAYQRVNTATDYDSVGFPIGLQPAADDCLYSAANVNLSGTDKLTVFAGVRKLSDAATGVLLEHGPTIVSNTGSFVLYAPSGSSPSFGFSTKGTLQSDASVTTGHAAPVSRVLTAQADIAADINTMQVNGVQVATSSADQGTGNFGSYVDYIGMRGGSSLPANLVIYQLICRGASTDAATVQRVNRYIAQKSGVVL